MAKITDRQMTAKPGASDKWLSEVAIWGHGSLVARITPSGERLFYFRYTNGSSERVTFPIGTYSRDGSEGTMTLAKAGLKAKELAGLHKSGIKDVKQHLEAEEAARVASRDAELARIAAAEAVAKAAAARLAARKTVWDLFDHWAKVDLINRKDGGDEVRRMFNKDVLPRLGALPLDEVRKGHITEVTDALLARGVNRMAKLIFSLMRQMFRFAVDRDLLNYDPTASIRKSKIGGKDVERDRVLSEGEISLLATQAPNAGLLPSTEAAIWIALSTCCRIGELMNARWENIDLKASSWVIPAEDSKNGKAHSVTLSNFAIYQFKIVKAFSGKSQWCYPNTKDTGPVCSKTVTKQLGDRQRQPDQGILNNRSAKAQALILKGGKWTPHDLRRTGATLMTALGVLPEVAERCLNHTEENKVKRTYQRHSYTKEMAAAWLVLGQHLRQLTRRASSWTGEATQTSKTGFS
ncbi:integrase [Pseudomonas sp. 10B238]|jgi:integrase|uniref:tyrosine-type recombinase/integrase n=1 Tax=Pseudomonadaceae TaxID=135621 RepID=UPI000617E067|nr:MULTISPECIES: site-specific integrase [Pseudomonadaceae]KJJ61621.1 integrase [Pseudomonas sp. 10B238]MBK3795223.1 tyrosine-type recombinase/integrase [Stutzerimonas stutzeri]MBK3878424.1 tyrosine-type recombinase/integrase [Stutzerimonas stutzeri]HBM09607.1 site-specific integrase [Pseudomonas sp.]|tara:strand:+ start:285 stop:1679 length:1395 start_codon:yes stop_codon:yes gene_type:complete